MTPAERKERSEKILVQKGIAVNPNLPLTEPVSSLNLRSLDDICKRAIAALLSTQIGVQLSEQRTDDAAFFVKLMNHFGVDGCLIAKEKRLLDGSFTPQDITDVVWEYECYWSLVWALGLIDDITDAEDICDCPQAIHLVSECSGFDEFRQRCKLRSADEIMSMLDLYYRYHWATVHREHIDGSTPTGKLNGDIVFERRRGLEWLISDTDDWNEIALHT